jgi:signal transduction histidine kinase
VATVIGIAERCADLTRHLLSFSRQQLLRPEALDLGTFFNKFYMTLSRTLDPRIRIDVVADANLPPVWVDATHLHTALLNLAINARDAMPSGGDLRIEASSGPTDTDGSVVIRVTDTGGGIAPDILAKVCEPFFTTKGLNGTGLGLSMVYGFAQQSGGDLRITSEPGHGTCVRLSLPRAAI